jgi:hypothetical protein
MISSPSELIIIHYIVYLFIFKAIFWSFLHKNFAVLKDYSHHTPLRLMREALGLLIITAAIPLHAKYFHVAESNLDELRELQPIVETPPQAKYFHRPEPDI